MTVPKQNEAAQKLYDEFEKWRYEDSPEFATMVGIHDYDDKLESYTLASWRDRFNKVTSFRDRVEALLKDQKDQNLEIFLENINGWLDGYKVNAFVFPLVRIEGIHVDFPQTISYMKFESRKDFEKLISRLSAFPDQIDGIIEVMKEGIRLNLTLHQVSLKNVVETLSSLVDDDPKMSAYFGPFNAARDDLKQDLADLSEKALNVIKMKVYPAFGKLRDFIHNDYIPKCRKDVGIFSVGGQEYYAQCLKFHLGYEISANEVHEKGLSEVKRINKDVMKVIEELGLKMTSKEFAGYMREQKEFYLKNENEIKLLYEKILEERIQPNLARYFRVLPEAKLRLVLMDKSRAAGPAAYYIQGSTDGTRPGTFYINGNNLERSPSYILPALALHEANPGHHLQTSRLLETKGIPSFRTLMEDRKYTEMPVHFPMHTAYTEGWGLYSEFLGHEMGVYVTPYERYGHYSQEMLRAGRLVVDTGMHSLGWTRQQAIDFLVENTSASLSEIESEVERYISWPGQACGYKIGEIKIKELREKAHKALGDKFHLADFHEVVMNHVGTMTFLAKAVDDFIAKTK